MSVSNIPSNLSALLNKAYNTGANATASDGISQLTKETTPATDSGATASASTQVTLGSTGNPAGTYTAQGLMQQLRQYQLSNASQMLGDDGDANNDDTGLTGLMGVSANTDQESMSQDWVKAISENPGKAAVMVASSQSNSLNTILGND